MLVAPQTGMATRHDRYAILAAGLLGIGVLFELFRLLPGHTWPGYAPILSRSVSASLIAVFGVTAVSAIFRRRHRVFASLAWTLGVLTPVFMVAHAAITRVGGSGLGLLYVLLAAATGFAMKRTLDRGESTRLPTTRPGGRPPEAARAFRLMPKPRH